MLFSRRALIVAFALVSASSSAFAMGKKKPAEPGVNPKAPLLKEIGLLSESVAATPVLKIKVKSMAQPQIEVNANAGEFGIYLQGAARIQDSAKLDRFLDESSLRQAGNEIEIHAHESGIYQCSQSWTNGALTQVNGVCLTRVKINLPADVGALKVYLNGSVIIGKMDYDDLIFAMSSAQNGMEKFQDVMMFLEQNPGRVVSIANAAQILSMLSFDSDRMNVCNALSGNISDPAHAASLTAKFDLESNREAAIKLLSE